ECFENTENQAGGVCDISKSEDQGNEPIVLEQPFRKFRSQRKSVRSWKDIFSSFPQKPQLRQV
ncbi:MAG: hypothetical protein IJ708_03280, partial [Clostridia bacterium]|nr:hypothetical protein [Clostridia bacterium]